MNHAVIVSPRKVATLVNYPASGQRHSHVSALYGYSKSLLTALPETDRRQHVVFSDLKDAGFRCFDDAGIEVCECWRKGSWRQWGQIVGALRRYPGIRLLHLQHEFNQFGGLLTIPMIPVLLAYVRVVLRVKTVLTLHEVVSPGMVDRTFMESNYLHVPISIARWVFGAYYRVLGMVANGFIVHDDYFRRILRADYGIKKPIRVIPHGVEDVSASLSKAEARAKLKVREDTKVLLFFGAVARYKGVDLVLDALEILDPNQYQLLIAGGTNPRIETQKDFRDWRETFEARCAQMPNVRLCGVVPDTDIHVYFMAADLLVLPYQIPRSMSGVMSLAAAYGLPFIASDAFREKVPDMFIFKQTPVDLVEKIQWFFDGRRQVMDNYLAVFRNERLWSKCAAATTQFYGAILSGK